MNYRGTRTMIHRAAMSSLVVATLLAGTGSTAMAQSKTSFGASAGASVPMGNYLNGLSTGYNVSVFLNMTNTTSPVGFRIEGLYNEMAFPGGGSASHRIAGGTANLTYDLQGMSGSATSGLYVIGGVGLYGSYDRSTASDGFVFDSNNSPTQTNFGLNGGLGYRFPLSDMTAFAEARVHFLFTNSNNPADPNYNAGNATFIPIVFGIAF